MRVLLHRPGPLPAYNPPFPQPDLYVELRPRGWDTWPLTIAYGMGEIYAQALYTIMEGGEERKGGKRSPRLL